MTDAMGMLILLLAWHCLADYPLQGDFLAKSKNRIAGIPGVPWYQAMAAHSAIHASGVFVITNSALLAATEFIAHFVIDDAKCRNAISFNTDQALHIALKLVYCLTIWADAT